ncbi:MAG: alpha/beta fold hydrolase [Candidatus Pelethousia sp.]|nr:alpha/beta fold hydrolase [Candidatus Pelethousia sp.]
MRETSFPSSTGVCGLHVCTWPCEAPRAALLTVHGMSEHILRYDEFARFLGGHGILAVGMDHASHGQSRQAGAPKGYFGPENGWEHLIEDIHSLRRRVEEQNPGLPLLMMGHSMGSFLARAYAVRQGAGLRGFIFMGTAGPNPALAIGKWLAERTIRQGRGALPSRDLEKLSTGSYGAPFRPNRTAFDWLSRDEARVDAYVADEDCGFPFTAAGYRDLFQGLMEVSDPAWAARVPKVPLLLLSGLEDPVGGKQAGGVKLVADRLVKSGHEVELLLYAHARHELLNELNRDEVVADILAFIDKTLAEA